MSLLNNYQRFLAETGSEVTAAFLAIDAQQQQQAVGSREPSAKLLVAARTRRERMSQAKKRLMQREKYARLRAAIKGKHKSGSAVIDLGCSLAELIAHLEPLFTPGMTWETMGKWHIDHTRPLASFDLTVREQPLQACHWTNLPPLWQRDNLSKGARLDWEGSP
jgi:hypothetical protein